MTTSQLRKSSGPATAGRGFLLIPFALALFALSPAARAVSPAPDGGYANDNTAEGTNALFSLTTGIHNTASGSEALFSNTTGAFNTATGDDALQFNTTGNFNTANGVSALQSNTTGNFNTASGSEALFSNTTGNFNTASGVEALLHNATGSSNTANGVQALLNNTTGTQNTATGVNALRSNTTSNFNTAEGVNSLLSNTTGTQNTATGVNALRSNTTGNFNTANGVNALYKSTGGSNIALGSGAGFNLTTGSNNIEIGNVGVAAEASTIRIGSGQTRTFIGGIRGRTTANANAVPVVIDSAGQLGTVSSSQRFKKEIKPMDQTSEAILGLKPVTFHYKSDSTGTAQFGLIAEEVAQVNPDLVVRDENGEIYTVRYEAVNAMLLNEFLKQHRTVQEQQKQIENLTARLKEQASQIRKVSDQLEVSKPAPRVVENNQ